MAFRIGSVITAGEIVNTRRNRVAGWLNFDDGETGIHLELSGNLEGELAGQHLRFEVPSRLPQVDDLDEVRQAAKKLQMRQIGAVGEAVFRIVKVPRGSLQEFLDGVDRGEHPPVDETPCLYLEWFSQNGRVVAEILNPQMSYGPEESPTEKEIEPEPLPDFDFGVGAVGFAKNEDGEYERIEFDSSAEDEDPYGLFPKELESDLEAAQEPSAFEDPEPTDDSEPRQKRNWADVPGIDAERAAMYEEWDEILFGDNHEQVTQLFDPPLALKPPQAVQDEAEAAELLRMLIGRLAMHSVAIDICEHYTALATYRWLMEEILPEARIHPRAAASGFVCHYSTNEFCETCDAEFDAEFEARERAKRKSEEQDEEDGDGN